MRLPIDTSAISFLCALAPEPVVDFETRRPKADENGEPLYVIQLLAMGTGPPTSSRSRRPACRRRPFARAPRSRSPAWSPSPGPWPTAPGLVPRSPSRAGDGCGEGELKEVRPI
jgi:hypothetical protein